MTLCADIVAGVTAKTLGANGMIFVHALGAAQIDAGDARVKPNSVRRFALLLHLSAERGRRVPRAALHDLIFPAQTERNALHSLRQLVYSLREFGVSIVSDAEGLELAAEAVRSDYSEVIERDRPDAAQLDAVAGGFLPGYAPEHSEAYAEWYEAYRSRALFDLSKAMLREVARAKRAADWKMMEKAARACLAMDAMNEEATLALAEVLAIGGAKTVAVDLLESYAREVGKRASELPARARVLARRIREEVHDNYLPQSDFPLVGREKELACLQQHLLDVRTSGGRCVALVGDAGIGKSRLAIECKRFAHLHGVLLVETASQPHDCVRPYSGFVDILPRLLELPGAAGVHPRSLDLIRRLTLSAQETVANSQESESQADSRLHILRALQDLVTAISDETPLVLIFEDAHWLDQPSLDVIRHITAHSGTQRVFTLLTARPNETIARELLGLRQAGVMRVEGLSAVAATALVRGMLSWRTATAPAEAEIEWILSTAGGNPLYLSTLAAHVRDTGDLTVPVSLRNLLEIRVDAVSPGARAVLLLCSMLGRHCSLDRVMAALRIPFAELLSSLAEIESAELLRAVNGAALPQPHPLVCDVIIRRTPDIARCAAHRCVAELLEADYEVHATPAFIWDSADHWSSAGDLKRAHRAYMRCVDDALRLGHPREAAELMCRAALSFSPRERRLLLERATLVASRAGEFDLVLRSTHMLRDDGWQPEHDDLELAELRALANWQNVDVIEGLRRCLADCPDDTHRVQAALVLMMAADAHRNPAAAHDAFAFFQEHCRQCDVSPELRLEGELIFACGFGNYADCSSLVDDLLTIAESRPLDRRAELQRKAGIALMRIGREQDALRVWIAGFYSARMSQLFRTQFDFALMITSHAHDIGASDVEAEWSVTLAELVTNFPHFGESLAYLSWRADVAASQKDVEELRLIEDRVRHLEPMTENARMRRWGRAVSYHINILGNKPINASRAVDELREWHVEDAESGDCSDFEIAAGAWALARSGEIGAARELIIDYLRRYRRIPSPMWSSLRVAAQDLSVLDEAMAILASKCRQPRVNAVIA